MLKRRDFIHQNIRYSFNWNVIYHLQKINQSKSKREEFKKLEDYFRNIFNNPFVPNHLFNQRGTPRVSRFKIRGLKRAFINSFTKTLIKAGKIEAFNSLSKFPLYVQNVYNSFKEQEISNKPGHDPVLKNILIKDKDSIAIEVPVWKRLKNLSLTGHIDLIQIHKNLVKVIDYKPEGNFLVSLPQVAMYGLIFKDIFDIKTLKCISFNINEAWEYNPEILLTDIKQYLISKKIERPWEQFLTEF